MKPTEWIEHLTIKKTPWNSFNDEEQKTYLPYIQNLFLSMVPELIETINETQLQQVPNRDHYNFYLKILPKKKLYMRWVKAIKKQYSKDVIQIIANYNQCGTREILDSVELFNDDIITDILQQTGLQDKQIKTLLK